MLSMLACIVRGNGLGLEDQEHGRVIRFDLP